MNDDDARVDRVVEEAMEIFFREESANIRSGISERNRCGGLARVLTPKLNAHGFRGYYVDLEYNRKQNREIRTIMDDNYQEGENYCDLIVNTRCLPEGSSVRAA